MQLIPFPAVRRHPEIVDILEPLAQGESDSAAAYDALARIIAAYLPEGASEHRAKLIGGLIATLTFSSDVRALAHTVQNSKREWAAQAEVKASERAIPGAIAVMLATTLLELEDPETKAAVKRAEEVLYIEQIKRRLAELGI